MHILVCTGGEGVVLVEAGLSVAEPARPTFAPRATSWLIRPCTVSVGNSPGFITSRLRQCGFIRERCACYPGRIRHISSLSSGDCTREIQTYRDETAIALWARLLHTACLRLVTQPLKYRFRLQPLWQIVEGNPAYPWNMALLSKRGKLACAKEDGFDQYHYHDKGLRPPKRMLRQRDAAL